MKNLIILLLLGLTIYLCYQIKHQKPLIEEKKIIDTVFIDKPFKPEKPYSKEVEPERVTLYSQPLDVFTAENSDSQNIQHINSDSLVQFLLKRDKLQMSYWNTDSQNYFTREFKIDLSKYKYNWYEGKLTQKRILNISPYAYTSYRPFNNLLDLGAGLQLKHKNLSYRLGFNTYHYPKYQSKMGTDLEISVIWQRQ